MPVNVNVKWTNGKLLLDNIALDQDEPPLIFKAKLMSLTGVPLDRQRLMCKGCVIKDDSWPDKFNVSDGAMLMLMGSSEKVPEAPVEKPKFVEDMTENELAIALDLPAGLTNLGNTCYMSATIQCLKTAPELREALNKYDENVSLLEAISNEPSNKSLTAALRDLYSNMDRSSVAEPIIMLRTLHNAIPRFAQRGEGNTFQQQDANECWTELTRILQQTLKPLNENSKHSNVIDEYFSGILEAELKCDEVPDEIATKSEENFLQLSCFISQDVRYMQAGLISRMKETITKFSPTLNRDASYTKVSRISRLPAYLTVQFVRFHYKGNVQTNAKLLRDVKFSMILDVYDLCSKELQERLAPMRAKYKLADDQIALSKAKALPGTNSADTPAAGPSASAASTEETQTPDSTGAQVGSAGESSSPNRSPDEIDLSSAKARFLANDKEEMKKYTFLDDPGSNNSGFYELKAVLTHKGRSSASGHYVGWIKRDDQWFKCDDDLVSAVDSDEILKLSGGGDWHCAYVCLYGPRFLELDNK